MKRAIASVILTLGVLIGIAFPSTTATAAPKSYTSCAKLSKVYANGVAKSSTAARRQVRKGNARPAVKLGVYKANLHLDRDKDGTACERKVAVVVTPPTSTPTATVTLAPTPSTPTATPTPTPTPVPQPVKSYDEIINAYACTGPFEVYLRPLVNDEFGSDIFMYSVRVTSGPATIDFPYGGGSQEPRMRIAFTVYPSSTGVYTRTVTYDVIDTYHVEDPDRDGTWTPKYVRSSQVTVNITPVYC